MPIEAGAKKVRWLRTSLDQITRLFSAGLRARFNLRTRLGLTGALRQRICSAFLGRLRETDAQIDWFAGREANGQPVLSALVRVFLANAERSLRELECQVARLHRGAPPGNVSIRLLRGPLSDYHSGGQSVWICDLSDDTTWYYKPRPVLVDAACADYFVRLRGFAAAPLGRPSHIVSLRDAGWHQATRGAVPRKGVHAAHACAGLGWLIALLHAFRTTDIHPENIVLGADGPVLVDAETLLHPLGPDRGIEYVGSGLRTTWNESLQRLNAFHARLAGDTTGRFTRLGWFETVEHLGWVSRPRLRVGADGEPVLDPGHTPVRNPHFRFWRAVRRLRPEWREDVWSGFEAGWKALQADRRGFAAAVKRCNAAPRRVIWRDTAAFHELQRLSLTGPATRSWEERRRFFSRPFGPPGTPPLTEREIDELMQGDIPRTLHTEWVDPADLSRHAESFREELMLCLREGGSEIRLLD